MTKNKATFAYYWTYLETTKGRVITPIYRLTEDGGVSYVDSKMLAELGYKIPKTPSYKRWVVYTKAKPKSKKERS